MALFSGLPADAPSNDFIIRNAADAQAIEIGWWPGDTRHPGAAFFAFAHPAPPTFAHGRLSPAAARWDQTLGEYILDWDDVRAAADPRAAALEFARSAFRHACLICGWDTKLAATADSSHPHSDKDHPEQHGGKPRRFAHTIRGFPRSNSACVILGKQSEPSPQGPRR